MKTSLPRLLLSPPHMSGMEEEFVKDAFASNWIAPLGPHVSAFEKEIAAYAGTKAALAVSSGTAALHLALKLLDISPGDTVFCSSFTFIGSANPILYQGAEPVFIDSNPYDWNMSAVALEKAFLWADREGRLPKAVVIVDLYGHSADYDRLMQICDYYSVPIIEDSAEALGSSYKGKACGSFGKYGIYSFNGNKIITTSGGGMLVSDDEESLEKALFWATQARDPAPWYLHSEMGYNYRMSNISAAIGRGQLIVLAERVAARRRVFKRYNEALSNLAGVSFIHESNSKRCNRWLTVMTINPQVLPVNPMDVINVLESCNIEARPVWKPMHLQPLFKDCHYFTHDDYDSVCDNLFKTSLCLPSGSNMSVSEQDRVIGCILNLFGK